MPIRKVLLDGHGIGERLEYHLLLANDWKRIQPKSLAILSGR